MYDLKKKEELISVFTGAVDKTIELVRMYGDLRECMEKDDTVMTKSLINEFSKAIRSALPEELEIPKITLHVQMSGTEDMIRVLDLVIRNKYSSNYKFNFKQTIVYSEDVFNQVADFFKCSYIELINDAIINDNLAVVNSKLAEISEKAGNSFKVSIASSLNNEGKKIAKITDDEIVFVAEEDRALALDDLLLLYKADELVSQESIDKAFEDEVAIFAQAQTTPQFVDVKDPLIGYICGISKLIKPITLIKKVYSKNVKKLRSNKDTLAYYHEDGVYAVIAVESDLKSVVLKPFDTETLEVVDVDVLANI